MSRKVIKTVYAELENDGVGAAVRRCITKNEQDLLDPFIMLVDFSVSRPGGFSDHPHRGFESVTYMLQGGITHQDFNGHKSTISSGDVQWLSIGRGIIHSEMAQEQFNNGLQLWINLPSTHKMKEPKCIEVLNSEIKRREKDGVAVKIIAGESMGIQSSSYTTIPIIFLDITLQPGSQIHQSVPKSWTAFAYIIQGDKGVFGSMNSSSISAHHVVVFGLGDMISVWNISTWCPLRFVLIAGEPISEPMVQHGPFVMNSQSEIDMTISDYRNAKNGFEKAKCWRSK